MLSMNAKAYAKLKNNHTNIHIAMYLPIDPGPEHTATNISKFNSAISTLKEAFKDVNTPKKEQQIAIKAVRSRTNEFTHPFAGKSAAIYLYNDNKVEVYELPFVAEPAIFIDLPNMHLEPIEHYYRKSPPYWVLTLSQHGCQLFKGDSRTFWHINDAKLAVDMHETLGLDETNLAGVQTHSAHEGGHDKAEGYHGHGGFKDMKKKYLRDYFRVIDARVKEHVDGKQEPIILVGVDHLQSLFASVSHLKHITPSRMTLDPHKTNIKVLRQLVTPTLNSIQTAAST